METTCTLPGCPIAGSGNPTTGRGEPPFFSAESTTPGEAAHVRDVFGPRNDCAGDADLLCESAGHQPEPPGPIIEPRASHMLLAERTRSNVLPTDYENPSIANKLFAAVRRDESRDVRTGLSATAEHPPSVDHTPRRRLIRRRVRPSEFASCSSPPE